MIFYVKVAIHFSLEDMIVKSYLYLSKLAAQMEFHNLSFDFGTTMTLILHPWWIYLEGGDLTKYGVKNIVMKILSKLGSLTVIRKIITRNR